MKGTGNAHLSKVRGLQNSNLNTVGWNNICHRARLHFCKLVRRMWLSGLTVQYYYNNYKGTEMSPHERYVAWWSTCFGQLFKNRVSAQPPDVWGWRCRIWQEIAMLIIMTTCTVCRYVDYVYSAGGPGPARPPQPRLLPEPDHPHR